MYDYIFSRIVNAEDEILLDSIDEVLVRNVDGLSPSEISKLRIIILLKKENIVKGDLIKLYEEKLGETTP